MSNLTNLEFVALDITGKNYLSRTLDAKIHLDATNLGDALKEGNQASLQECPITLIFVQHHLHEDLKSECLIVKDLITIWNDLKEDMTTKKL